MNPLLAFFHRLAWCLWLSVQPDVYRRARAAIEQPPVMNLGPLPDVLGVWLETPLGHAVRYAVAKVAADAGFHPSKDHALKHREALEWASHYAREHGTPWDEWQARLLLECAVGERKGRLT